MLTGNYTPVQSGTGTGNSSCVFANLINGQYEFFVNEPSIDCIYSQTIDISSYDFYLYNDLNATNNTQCITPNGGFSLNIIDPSLPNNYEITLKNLYTGVETTTIEATTGVTIPDLNAAYYAVQIKDLDNPTCIIQQAAGINNYTAYLSVTEDSKTGQQNCASPYGSIAVTVSGGTPATTNRTITFIVNDGLQNSNAISHTLTINQPPHKKSIQFLTMVSAFVINP